MTYAPTMSPVPEVRRNSYLLNVMDVTVTSLHQNCKRPVIVTSVTTYCLPEENISKRPVLPEYAPDLHVQSIRDSTKGVHYHTKGYGLTDVSQSSS